MEGSETIPQGSRPEDGPKCEPQTKRCGGCAQTKTIGDFGLHSRHGRQTWCRDCMSWAQLSRKFGITREQFHRLLIQQKGACAICGLVLASVRIRRPDLDHDHKTGEIRGILCRNCNVALGLMKESPVRLRQAAVYLEAHGSGCDDIVPASG